MSSFKIAVIVGSLRKDSFNRKLALSLANLAPTGFTLEQTRIDDLPFYNQDDDANQSTTVKRFKAEIAAAQGLLFVTPEYNRSIPGGLKNAIDWASRPWGQNSFARKPSAVIGASVGAIGTAVAQQSLRSVLSFCNSPQMNAPEAYIHFKPGLITDDGQVTDDGTADFLRNYMNALHLFIVRVLTVLPRGS